MTTVANEFANTISLNDKYDKRDGQIYLTGIQALVRLPLDRIRLDREAGLNTAAFISGYRGSPVGTYDQQLRLAQSYLDDYAIKFIPGVNEELAATAVWGTQKVGLTGAGSLYDGVLGIWYGKAPGVDRSCDAFRHANFSGTARHGGVLAVAGDDPLAKSSTVVCQSEMAFMDVEMPIFMPGSIQEVLDFGLHAFALSRYAGVWSGMIALADLMDGSARISVDPDRLDLRLPDEAFDPRAKGKMNRIMALAGRGEHEVTLREWRLPAARAYIRANGLNGVRFGAARPRIGLVAAGKAYHDLLQAFLLLGIGHKEAEAMGIGVYKVAVSWPLEPEGIKTFAAGLERLFVVEHKRPVMEPQIKEMAYCWQAEERPPIWGKVTPEGAPFLPSVREVTSFELVPALLAFLPDALVMDAHQALAEKLKAQANWARAHASSAARIPYFCSGCPHSSSTIVPEGARVLAGIGCHSMTEATGRITDSLAMMGGEGMQWVGQHAFDRDRHVFANLGDGTYFHSGMMAIRQAVAAKVPITYKILYNDAVAMTGGQAVDGVLTVPKMTRQLQAEGVGAIIVVSERPHLYTKDVGLADGVEVRHRDYLIKTEEELAAFDGVSALIYDQTCAAEKRRRRKRGTYEIPDKRLFINDRVCEACGDCSVQSNCLSVEPLETEFGTKRAINQSSCNLDFTCVKGFCPSFVWVEGAELRKADSNALDIAALVDGLEEPAFDAPRDVRNILIAGVGGMGVTTVAAILAMAGHIDGLNVSTVDMTGIAQKGGPVSSHVRLAPNGMDIEGPRIPVASMDVLLSGDLLVASNAESLAMADPERTVAICNSVVAPTAEFVLKQSLSFETGGLQKLLQGAVMEARFSDAVDVAESLLGDAIYTNMILVGMAWQMGVLPIGREAIEQAITLNKASVGNNLRAFALGRLFVGDEARLRAMLPQPEVIPERDWREKRDFYAEELIAYQGKGYAKRYQKALKLLEEAEVKHLGEAGLLSEAATEQLYRLMAYKDEYEVARLMLDPAFTKKLDAKFSSYSAIRLELSPFFLRRTDPKTGRQAKRSFGKGMWAGFKLLRRFKWLRGTPFDPFGWQAERKAERAWKALYLKDLKWISEMLSEANADRMLPLVMVPATIRGYGSIKQEAMEKASIERLAALENAKNPKGSSKVREAFEARHAAE